MGTIMNAIAATNQSQPGNPDVIVIQPTEPLTDATSAQFIQQVTNAICQATDTVIIDFLWVVEVDQAGILALATVIDRANKLGKAISLQSLQTSTRTALTAMLTHKHQQALGTWQEAINSNLEQFLTQTGHWSR